MDGLLQRFEPSRRLLAQHPLYDAIETIADIRDFMEHHVYAVWDFMFLLKGLQSRVVVIDTPPSSAGTEDVRALVDELVREEESDEIGGVTMSHFDLYRQAMRDAGADVGPIERLMALIADGQSPEAAVQLCGAPLASERFSRATFATIAGGRPHAIAAAFTFGREDAIPTMFGRLTEAMPDPGTALGTFGIYLERHIELDGGSHGDKAIRMLAALCGDDQKRWDEAADAAILAVDARLALWDAILDAIEASRWEPAQRLVGERSVALK